MLRYSNPNALRTGVERSMALRIPLRAQWPRAIHNRPHVRPTQNGSVLPRLTPACRVALSARPFTTDVEPEAPEENEDTAVAGEKWHLYNKGQMARHPMRRVAAKGRTLADLLYIVALSGTSSAAKEQSSDLMVSRATVERELRWLQDPKELSDRIYALLRNGGVALAAALVRQAQKENMECGVAWNSLFVYCFENGAADAAYKFYHDMKKRGRQPSSHTYTIMLDGISETQRGPGMTMLPVKTALSIYRSIGGDRQDFRPEIKHTNAMLKVCANHLDTNTLWTIAGELPETGPSSPDGITYTILLRAVELFTKHEASKFKPHEVNTILARRAQGLREGKQIWAEVLYRWKAGLLTVENQIVTRMSSLLRELATCDHDIWQGFALYKQTHNIPILSPEPPKPAKTYRYVKPSRPRKKQEQLEDVPFVDENEELYHKEKVEADIATEEASFENLFDPVVETSESSEENQGESPVLSYVPTSNIVLTNILTSTLTMSQGLGSGKRYWEYLTDPACPVGIVPDRISYENYLRILRRSRSSRISLDLVGEMVSKGFASGKIFHIAITGCLRDRKNPNVFKTANGLLQLMDENEVLPDERALKDYFKFIQVLEENPQLLMSLNGIDAGENGKGNDLSGLGTRLKTSLLVTAAEHLRPHITKLDDAVEHCILQERPLRPQGRVNPYGFRFMRGEDAVRMLAYMRLFLRDIVTKYAKHVPEATLKVIAEDAKKLSRYSDRKILDKCKFEMVGPSPKQVLAFRDRENRATEDAFD